MFILRHRKLQWKHPYPFIAFACLAEATMNFLNFVEDLPCYKPIPWLFNASLGLPWYLASGGSRTAFNNIESPEDMYIAMKLITNFNLYIYDVAMYLDFHFNSIIFIDLYLAIKNPFAGCGGRAKYFYASSTIITMYIIISKIIASFVLNKTDDLSFLLYILYSSFLLVPCFIFTALVLLRLNKKGTSSDLKNTILKRHIIYFVLYMVFAAK